MKVIWLSSFSLLLSEADFLHTIIFLCDPRTLFCLVMSHIHYWMYQVINKNDSELIFLALEHLLFLAPAHLPPPLVMIWKGELRDTIPKQPGTLCGRVPSHIPYNPKEKVISSVLALRYLSVTMRYCPTWCWALLLRSDRGNCTGLIQENENCYTKWIPEPYWSRLFFLCNKSFA